ncbi:OST-HTH/LOTUS domain-containing protein [Stenotrophomonas maltophilia]|nr:OST-HTH/LOTUS domain-containing protein [Stenotrophomonas maltophilia]
MSVYGTLAGPAEVAKPIPKRRPRFLVDAVALLADGTTDGEVVLGTLGHYLKRTDPSFSPKAYGHSGLLDMIQTYDLLTATQAPGGHWLVRLAPQPESTAA